MSHEEEMRLGERVATLEQAVRTQTEVQARILEELQGLMQWKSWVLGIGAVATFVVPVIATLLALIIQVMWTKA